MDGNQTVAGIGHNRPNIPTPEILRELLAEECADLVKRADDLLEAANDPTRSPETVETEDVCGKMSAFLVQIQKCVKQIKARHQDAKAPALDAGRAIDSFFFTIRDKLIDAHARLNKRNEVYLVAKADAERRRREEEARRAQDEQRRKEAEALKAMESQPNAVAEAKVDDAIQAQTRADEAVQAAAAKPAELARTRSDYGTMATLRTEWTGEVENRAMLDLAALREHLDLEALNKAVRAFVKAGGRNLDGARIYEKHTAINR